MQQIKTILVQTILQSLFLYRPHENIEYAVSLVYVRCNKYPIILSGAQIGEAAKLAFGIIPHPSVARASAVCPAKEYVVLLWG